MDISVAIGRNVGETPMAEDKWDDYQNEALSAIIRYKWVVYLEETGKASYQGSKETFARFWAKKDDYRASDILDLRRDLSDLAHKYGQWGIALTYATTEIISPKPDFIEGV